GGATDGAAPPRRRRRAPTRRPPARRPARRPRPRLPHAARGALVNDERPKIRQVLRQIDDHTVDMVADEHHAAVAEYLDPDRLRREEALLFRRFPIAV